MGHNFVTGRLSYKADYVHTTPNSPLSQGCDQDNTKLQNIMTEKQGSGISSIEITVSKKTNSKHEKVKEKKKSHPS